MFCSLAALAIPGSLGYRPEYGTFIGLRMILDDDLCISLQLNMEQHYILSLILNMEQHLRDAVRSATPDVVFFARGLLLSKTKQFVPAIQVQRSWEWHPIIGSSFCRECLKHLRAMFLRTRIYQIRGNSWSKTRNLSEARHRYWDDLQKHDFCKYSANTHMFTFNRHVRCLKQHDSQQKAIQFLKLSFAEKELNFIFQLLLSR